MYIKYNSYNTIITDSLIIIIKQAISEKTLKYLKTCHSNKKTLITKSIPQSVKLQTTMLIIFNNITNLNEIQ